MFLTQYKIRWLFGAALCSIALHSASFKPDKDNYGHTYITRVATKPENAQAYKFTLNIDGAEQAFTDEAVGHLVDGVQAPDRTGIDAAYYASFFSFLDQTSPEYLINVPSENTSPSAHCDDQLVAECADRISSFIRDRNAVENEKGAVQLFQEGAQLLLSVNPSDYDRVRANSKAIRARIKIGRALHTLQDFYAHSNWSDRAKADARIFTALTGDMRKPIERSKVSDRIYGPGTKTCEPRRPSLLVATGITAFSWADNGGNFEFSTGTVAGNIDEDRITTGYFTLTFQEQIKVQIKGSDSI